MIDPALARSIRLVGLDVDGVMTDGGIYLGAADGKPVELKRYEIQDGLGVHFMQRAGLRVAIVTGRVSESVRLRARELDVDDVAQDANARKLPGFLAMLDRHGIAPSEAAFLGDDFPDLAVLRLVGLPSPSAMPCRRFAPHAHSSSRAPVERGPCASSPSCCSRHVGSGTR